MKLTKAEKREAKRGIQTCVLCSSYHPSLRSALRTSPNLYPRKGGGGDLVGIICFSGGTEGSEGGGRVSRRHIV